MTLRLEVSSSVYKMSKFRNNIPEYVTNLKECDDLDGYYCVQFDIPFDKEIDFLLFIKQLKHTDETMDNLFRIDNYKRCLRRWINCPPSQTPDNFSHYFVNDYIAEQRGSAICIAYS